MSAAGSSNRKHQQAGTVVRFAASDADYATAVIEAAGQVVRASGVPRASKMGWNSSAGDALTSGPRRASIVPGSASIGIPAHFKKSRNSRLNRGFEALWKRQVLSASKRRTGILPTLSDSQRNRAFPESLKTWHKTLQDNTQRFHGTVGTVLENYVTEEDWQASMDWRMELIHQEQEERWAVMEAQIQAQRTRKSSIMRRVDNLGQDFGVWTQDEDDDAPAVEDLGPLANPLRKLPLRPRPQPPKAPSPQPPQRTARGVPPRRRQIKRLPARAPVAPVAPTPAPTPDAAALAIDDLRRVSCVPMMLSSAPRRTAMHSVAFQLNLPSAAGAGGGAISATMPRSTFARASLAHMQPSSPVGPHSPGSMRPTMSRFAKNTLPSPTADGPVASVDTQPQNQQPSQHCALSQQVPGPTKPSAPLVDVDMAADRLPPGLVPATEEDLQLILEYERAYIDGTATALVAARRDSQSCLAMDNMATAPSTPKHSQASNGSAVVKYPLIETNSGRGRPEHTPGSKPGTPGSCKGSSKGLHTPRTPLHAPSSPTMTQVYLQFGGKSAAPTPSASRPQSRQTPGSRALSSTPLNSPFWDCPVAANPAGSTQAALDPGPIASPDALEREDGKAWAGLQVSNENCRLSGGDCDTAELLSKNSTANLVIVPAAATCAEGAQSPAEADNHQQECGAPSPLPSSPDDCNDLQQHQEKGQLLQAVQTPIQTDSNLQRAGSSALQTDSAPMIRSGSGRPVSARLWQSSSRLGSAGAGSSSSGAGAVILEDIQHAGHDGRGVDWDECEMVTPWAAEDYGQRANSFQQVSLLGPHLQSHLSTCASEHGGEGKPLLSCGTFTTPASPVKLMAYAAYEYGTASPRHGSMAGMDAELAARPSQHLHAAFKDRQAFSTPSMPGADTAHTVQIGSSRTTGVRSRTTATVTVDVSSTQHTLNGTMPMQHQFEVPQTHCCKTSGTQKVPSSTSLPGIRRSAPCKPALPIRHALPVPRDVNNSGLSTTVGDPGRGTARASLHQKRILEIAFPTLASPSDAHAQAAQHDRDGAGNSCSDDGGLPGIQPLQPQTAAGDHASLSTPGAHDQLHAQSAHPSKSLSQGARAGVIHPVPRPLAGCPPYGMPTNPLQFGKHRLRKGKTPPVTQAMAWITAWHDHSIRSEADLQRVVCGMSPLPLGVLEKGC